MKENILLIEGTVTKIHANIQFSVKSEKITNPIICYLAGKISKNHVKPEIGDRVSVEIYPYDLTKGRIVSVKR